ncbi:MAG: hypothetical protein H7A36_07510 [Chlamydiales bacterium]|nr:hypothetical protein [Chlamydiales bacterium]
MNPYNSGEASHLLNLPGAHAAPLPQANSPLDDVIGDLAMEVFAPLDSLPQRNTPLDDNDVSDLVMRVFGSLNSLAASIAETSQNEAAAADGPPPTDAESSQDLKARSSIIFGNTEYVCCNTKFPELHSFRVHLKLQHFEKQQPVVCLDCGQDFLPWKYLNVDSFKGCVIPHLNLHNGTLYCCAHCETTHTNKRSSMRHVLQNHSGQTFEKGEISRMGILACQQKGVVVKQKRRKRGKIYTVSMKGGIVE